MRKRKGPNTMPRNSRATAPIFETDATFDCQLIHRYTRLDPVQHLLWLKREYFFEQVEEKEEFFKITYQ